MINLKCISLTITHARNAIYQMNQTKKSGRHLTFFRTFFTNHSAKTNSVSQN